MYLADIAIKKCLKQGEIKIIPEIDLKHVRPAGIRVHLAKKILIPKPGQTVSLRSPGDLQYDEIDLSKKKFTLGSDGFILASTVEKIKTASDILTFLDGRSTVARLGLTTHVTAGVIDGNHDDARSITLEIKNLGKFSVELNEGDAIGLVLFAKMTDKIVQPSQSQYAGQDGVVAPNLDFRPGVDS